MQPERPTPSPEQPLRAYEGQKIDVMRPSSPSPMSLQDRKRPGWHNLKPVLSILAFIAGVIIAASAINAFIFQSYYVEGTSMVPTLQDSDRLIIDKTGHTMATIKGQTYVPDRGDIVVLNSDLPDPRNNGQTEQLIKRVIGLPGERIVIENGQITIFNGSNPEGFNPDALLGLELSPAYTGEPISTTLSKDEVFVIGDNRAAGGSLDSRAFGPVEASAIQGRLWARIFPLSNAKLF